MGRTGNQSGMGRIFGRGLLVALVTGTATEIVSRIELHRMALTAAAGSGLAGRGLRGGGRGIVPGSVAAGRKQQKTKERSKDDERSQGHEGKKSKGEIVFIAWVWAVGERIPHRKKIFQCPSLEKVEIVTLFQLLAFEKLP
jgi:hypothetical protein